MFRAAKSPIEMTTEVIDASGSRPHSGPMIQRSPLGLAVYVVLAGCGTDPSVLETHSIVVNRQRVTYDLVGVGEPALVFVHGAISTREVWTDARTAFSAERRVLTLDLPGHGESADPETYRAQDFSDAVLAAMDDAGIDRAVIAGHSFGVPIARDVALAAPGRIAGLYMLDGFVVPIADPGIGAVVLDAFRSPSWADSAAAFIEQFMIGPDTPPVVADRVRAMMGAGSQAQWLGVLEISLSPAVERDDVVSVPTQGYFLPGATFPRGYDEYLAARFVPFDHELAPEGSGHFLMWERPADVERTLRALLARATE